MYRRRKHIECLNCGAKLDKVYNYCPVCGQENTDNKVNFKTLIGDFFNNYLSIDSRLGNSIKPFLFKPGFLTNEFIKGRRVSFMHPIRLYLVMSLFYFFIISLPSLVEEEVDQNDGVEEVELAPGVKVFSTESGKQELSVDSLIATIDSAYIDDKLISDNQLKEKDSVDDEFWIITDENMEIFNDLKFNRDFSDQQVLDSLNTENMDFWEIILAKQLIRVGRSDQQNLAGYIVKNLPIMMFFMLPVFAMILRIFYFRTHLYIEHLVHAFHLHSFFYFIFGIAILIYKIVLPFEWIQGVLIFSGIIWVIIYVFKSYRKVYSQKWFKTLVKFILVGFIYNIVLWIAFIVELGISLLIY